MFLVALVPPLWFRVMDPLLLAHTKRDPRRIHFDPKRRAMLCARYGLADGVEPEATTTTVAAA